MTLFAKDFPIVCIGGSAGGLNAYVQVLEGLPPDLGVAIVIVNHRTRSATALHKILPRHTEMPVELITDYLGIQPNRVFVIASNRELHVLNGMFRLTALSKPTGWPNVITIFLHSLAQNWGGKIFAVVASGLDGDGAAALSSIKEVGGITMAQTPDTAEWSGMPESAIKTGHVDFVLCASDIGHKITELANEFEPRTKSSIG